MFSSNQIFEISGNLSHHNELEMVLEFALDYSDEVKNTYKEEFDRGCKLLYQITEDGKYCIGSSKKTIPDGWNEYSFRFNIDTVSKIIRQHLETFPLEKGNKKGSYEKGFIMKRIEENMNEECDGFHGIVYFKPFTCFYSK